MKSVMFVYFLLCTIFRIVSGIFVFNLEQIALPKVVIVNVAILVLLGIYLIVRRIFFDLKLRELVVCAVAYLGIIAFNIAFIALSVPIKLALAESLIVGSLFEIILLLVFLYYAGKNLRNQYITVDTDISIGEEEGDLDD